MTLLRISHYHHRTGGHPGGRRVPEQEEYIELLTRGRGWILHENQWEEVTAGTLLWHKPGDYTIQRSDQDNPYSCLVVHYHTHSRAHSSIPRISRWNDLDEILQLTHESLQRFIDTGFDNEVLLNYLTGKLAYHAYRHHWSQRRDDLPPPLKRVIALIEKEYPSSLTLAEMAEVSGWSIPHLHELFRQHLHQTPYQFLLSRRIHSAKIRLASTLQPIKQIAVECGFQNPSSFSTAFRKLTSMSPAKYRRENQDTK